MFKTCFLAISVLALSACQTISGEKRDQVAEIPVSQAKIPSVSNASDQDILINGNTAFAADIYKQSMGKDGNIFISPASISTAFGLAYMGSRGQTAQEISEVMHYDLPEDRLHPAIGQLTANLEDQESGQVFTMANALFTDKTTVLEPEYLAMSRTHYGAEENAVDFRNTPEIARQAINLWVENKTHGLIPETYAKNTIIKKHRNVMVNTAYLKASWSFPFHEGATKSEKFTTPSGDVLTPMMHRTAELPYYKGKGFKAVELPYQGGTMSMVLVLPNRVNGLSKFEAKLSAKNIQKWLSSPETITRRKVILTLPKISLKDNYELSSVLKEMGMKTPFSDLANFSGRIDATKQPDGLSTMLNKVIHKTVLEIDERGTEAAAVTAIDGIIVTGSNVNPPKPVTFKADHPFLLFIQHKETGAILFMGRVSNPTQ